MSSSLLQDCHGKTIAPGDIVKIISLSKEFIRDFPSDERILIESMVGQLFKIYGVDEFGQPYVIKEWHDEHGQLQTHVIALDPHEMEKI
jgi:hypothetical protein